MANATIPDDVDISSLAAMERKVKARPASPYDYPAPAGPQKVVVEHTLRVSQRDVAIGVCFGMMAFSLIGFLFWFLVSSMFIAAESAR